MRHERVVVQAWASPSTPPSTVRVEGGGRGQRRRSAVQAERWAGPGGGQRGPWPGCRTPRAGRGGQPSEGSGCHVPHPGRPSAAGGRLGLLGLSRHSPHGSGVSEGGRPGCCPYRHAPHEPREVGRAGGQPRRRWTSRREGQAGRWAGGQPRHSRPSSGRAVQARASHRAGPGARAGPGRALKGGGGGVGKDGQEWEGGGSWQRGQGGDRRAGPSGWLPARRVGPSPSRPPRQQRERATSPGAWQRSPRGTPL